MATRTPRYPTLPELRTMSLQELYDRRLAGIPNLPSLAGTVDSRKL